MSHTTKELEWVELNEGKFMLLRQWESKEIAFYINFDSSRPEESQYRASWGEHEINEFPCLESAKAWCQELLEDFIGKYSDLHSDTLIDIAMERNRQDKKWGGSKHDDQHTTSEFIQWIEDYAGWARMMSSMESHDKARKRLIQVAALAVAAVESMDRKEAEPMNEELYETQSAERPFKIL